VDATAARLHGLLAAGIAAVLACEIARGGGTLGTSEMWPLLEAAIVATALLFAWRRQHALRLAPLLVLAAAFEAGWAIVHLALGVNSDFDSAVVYPREGNALLHGHYPDTEYPPAAILVFAFDALVSGGGAHGVRTAHAFVMIPFQLTLVAAVWLLRSRWSAWLAAVVALWPSNAWFWELKYDLAPTAALVTGIALAQRGRWVYAGAALGVGAALKWTPGLTAATLVLWLLVERRNRDAFRHGAAAAGVFLLVNAPFAALWPGLVAHSYRVQAGRGITGESFQYLLLRLVGRAEIPPGSVFWTGVDVPSWATTAASLFQIVCVAATVVAVTRCRHRLDAALAVAVLAPVIFLLTTRTFSPQYLVTALAGWAAATALVAQSRREQLALAAAGCGSALANVLVYPTVTPTYWWFCSWWMFLLGFGTTGWLLVRSQRRVSH
jgi:glycosyl transferase family 87